MHILYKKIEIIKLLNEARERLFPKLEYIALNPNFAKTIKLESDEVTENFF